MTLLMCVMVLTDVDPFKEKIPGTLSIFAQEFPSQEVLDMLLDIAGVDINTAEQKPLVTLMNRLLGDIPV